MGQHKAPLSVQVRPAGKEECYIDVQHSRFRLDVCGMSKNGGSLLERGEALEDSLRRFYCRVVPVAYRWCPFAANLAYG